ncbi:MAG: PBP1A family penicillin-binding protein [Calditrichaceae bacterium]|nr:PBP1A family penicillin-binding protein [Calditrichaceae bacterium]MBN2707762.1 PBP1A family penicillin-binding protein [Calditrichaceae bacterium]RQV96396.1 MAG: PBP1A family penicillin-binding protein [Calditrichota bacterium]
MKRKRRISQNSTRITKSFRPPTSVMNPLMKKDSSGTKRMLKVLLITIFSLIISVSIFLYVLSLDLPSLNKLEQISPAMASQVYSSDGEIIYSFFRHENRRYIPFERIPEHVIDALLAVEDREFHSHWGVNLMGIVRALIIDLRYMEIRQGGSTMTMQLAKNLFLTSEQNLLRKIKEAMLAVRIESTYSKSEILSLYLNIVPFGNQAFGIQAAARRYFDKSVEELTVDEGAMLIGILKGNTWYSPIRHPERAKQRRNVVINSLVDYGKLEEENADTLRLKPLNLSLVDPHEMKIAPYFTEHVRRQLNSMQDSLGIDVYESGLRIYTTLNTDMQAHMERAVTKRISWVQERVHRQSIFRTLKETMNDSAFNALSTVQVAFAALNPQTGHILAMIGGRDFTDSKFNRVTQMRRQPGSAIKPFLYTAAIDNGYTPADVYPNLPTVEFNADGSRWTPKNYDGRVGGERTLRDALRNSINLIAIRLINDITPQSVIEYIRSFGITTSVRPYSSLALGGSCEVIPLELISAFGAFANNGILVKPLSILRIEDKNGNVIYEPRPEGRRREVISPVTNYIMNSMLQDVVSRGTGYPIRRDFQFFYPAGGKTGTTNDFTNAWFIGYTPDIVAGIWLGLDDFQYNLGQGMAGGVAAVPFWGEFMKAVYDSVEFSKHQFREVSNIVKLKLCSETHKIAGPFCPSTYEEVFNPRHQIKEKCDIHTGREIQNNTRRRTF